jgi:hypothetical protein
LKLKPVGDVTVTENVTWWLSEPLVAVTTTDNVPLVVMSVGTMSVAVPGVLIELDETVHVTPDGQPEVTLRLTVPLNPPPAVMVRVLEAVPPAPMLCEVGEALMVKSAGGGPVGASNVAMAPIQ